MRTINLHTASVEIPVHYHFACDCCGKDSGVQTIPIYSATRTTSEYGYLTPQKEASLKQNARTTAQGELQLRRQSFENGDWITSVIHKCPHCGKKQSWWLSWQLQSAPLAHIGYAAMGAVFGSLIFMLDLGLFRTKNLMLGILSMPVLAALGLALGFIARMKAKKAIAKAPVGNEPEFTWPDGSGGTAVFKGSIPKNDNAPRARFFPRKADFNSIVNNSDVSVMLVYREQFGIASENLAPGERKGITDNADANVFPLGEYYSNQNLKYHLGRAESWAVVGGRDSLSLKKVR